MRHWLGQMKAEHEYGGEKVMLLLYVGVKARGRRNHGLGRGMQEVR
jgi:hypothetical protein